MSHPLSTCLVIRAAKGDEEAYNELLKIYTINYKIGHWTQFGCSCSPPCERPTDEQNEKFQARFKKYFEDHPVKADEWGWSSGYSGKRGYVLTRKMIQQHAYFIWTREGGNPVDNWLLAEKELGQMGADGTLTWQNGNCCECHKAHYLCRCVV